MDYVAVVLELDKQWPPERLRQFILDELRESCEWAKQKKLELESENQTARMRGVPYSERKKYTVKINALEGLFLKWRERGIKYSKHQVKVSDLVQPIDLEFINTSSFEHHLKGAILW